MILSICLNTSLDTRYTAPGFRAGKIIATEPPHITAGGKALNLARVAAILGGKVTAAGLVGQESMDFFCCSMAELDITPQFLATPNPSRRCLNIIDPETNLSTQLLEKGYPLKGEDFAQFLVLLEELIPQATVVCLSGSVPPGLPGNVYARIGELARKHNRPFILDARGQHLREGLEARPFAVKPNLQELEEYAGRPLKSRAEQVQALKDLNADLKIVTLGEEGALCLTGDSLWQISMPPIEAKNPVGSGDAFVAGLSLGLVKNLPLKDALALAAAAGAANALEPGTGQVDPLQVEALLPQVKVFSQMV